MAVPPFLLQNFVGFTRSCALAFNPVKGKQDRWISSGGQWVPVNPSPGVAIKATVQLKPPLLTTLTRSHSKGLLEEGNQGLQSSGHSKKLNCQGELTASGRTYSRMLQWGREGIIAVQSSTATSHIFPAQEATIAC